MAQNTFDFAGAGDRSYSLLDANFTQLWSLRDVIVTPAYGAYSGYTPASYAIAVDPSMRCITGDTTASATRVSTTNVTAQWQIKGTTLGSSSQGMFTFESTSASSCPYLLLGRSRNAAVGSHTVVNSGDFLAAISVAGSDGTQFTEACRMTAEVDGTPGTNDMPGRWVFRTTADGASSPSEVMRLDSNQAALFSSATGGFGYRAGAGSSATQATSKSTGVTVNAMNGQVTMNAAALAAGTTVGFTLTNSSIAAHDAVIPWIKSGGTNNSYSINVTAVAAGSCRIEVRNTSGGSLSEALVLGFMVIRGSIT